MNYISSFKSIFSTTDLKINENFRLLEIKILDLPLNNIPAYDNVISIVNNIPQRDYVKISLKNESDDYIIFTKQELPLKHEFTEFVNDAKLGEHISVYVEIEKKIQFSKMSIYCFDSFVKYLLTQTNEKILLEISNLLTTLDYINFIVYDRDLFFKSKTMVFSSTETTKMNAFERLNRINACQETTYFYNISSYNLLPDDFYIEVDFLNNPLAELFKKLTTLLSLVYLSTSAVINNGTLKIQILGQRSLDFTYNNLNIISNLELYKIYNWIFTEGNHIDKSIIAHNIISLHCKHCNIINIDNKTFASIQSNFNLYLKNNVNQYIELTNKVSEYIMDVVSKTGDYATIILGKFKSNLIAISGFIFTVIIANISSSQPLDNIFTNDIAFILEVILLGSAIYLIISIIEVNYQKNRTIDSYYKLKDNYKNILTDQDIQEIFGEDKLIHDMKKRVNKGTWCFSILWAIIIIAFIISIEIISDGSIFFYLWNQLVTCLKLKIR